VIIICGQHGGDNLSYSYAISLSVAPFEWTVARINSIARIENFVMFPFPVSIVASCGIMAFGLRGFWISWPLQRGVIFSVKKTRRSRAKSSSWIMIQTWSRNAIGTYKLAYCAWKQGRIKDIVSV
jgi:hypothetical protein